MSEEQVKQILLGLQDKYTPKKLKTCAACGEKVFLPCNTVEEAAVCMKLKDRKDE